MYLSIFWWAIIISITLIVMITSSLGRGIITRLLWWCILWWYSIYHGHYRSTIVVWLTTWIIIVTRLMILYDSCRTIPSTLNWTGYISNIIKPNSTYIINHSNYQRLYYTKQSLSQNQQLQLYAKTTQLSQCLSLYIHIPSSLHSIKQRLWGWSFDYYQWLTMKWVNWLIQWKHIPLPTIQPTSYIQQTRTLLIDRITSIFRDSRSAWWVAGSLIGSKDLIDNSDYQILINSWLVHLIVVSGWNLALLILLFSGILFRIPFYIRSCILAIILIWYVAIVGADSSVLRALMMSLIILWSTLIGIQQPFSRLIIGVVSILLLYNPMMIYDIWLRLSIGAVSGIFIVHQRSYWYWTSNNYNMHTWYMQLILIVMSSIGAWLGTLPFLVRQFGSANLTSIITNSLIWWRSSIIMLGELIIVGLSFIDHTRIQSIIYYSSHLIQRGIHGIYYSAELTIYFGLRIWAWNQWGLWMIVMSIVIWFILLSYHTQQLKTNYLLEINQSVKPQ